MRALRTKRLELSRPDLRARAWSCWPEEREEEEEHDLRAETRENSMGFKFEIDFGDEDEEENLKCLVFEIAFRGNIEH